MRNHWTEIEKYLEDQKIAQELIGELRDFHMRYTVEDQVKERVEKPDMLFYGKKILEMSTAALLQGDNLLLSGAKATGKNVQYPRFHTRARHGTVRLPDQRLQIWSATSRWSRLRTRQVRKHHGWT